MDCPAAQWVRGPVLVFALISGSLIVVSVAPSRRPLGSTSSTSSVANPWTAREDPSASLTPSRDLTFSKFKPLFLFVLANNSAAAFSVALSRHSLGRHSHTHRLHSLIEPFQNVFSLNTLPVILFPPYPKHNTLFAFGITNIIYTYSQ